MLFLLCIAALYGGNEQKLYNDLMKNYNKKVRPVWNASTLIEVKLTLSVIQVVEMVCIVSGHCLSVCLTRWRCPSALLFACLFVGCWDFSDSNPSPLFIMVNSLHGVKWENTGDALAWVAGVLLY